MVGPQQLGGVVLGIGCDLAEVDRIRAIHERHGDRFLGRVYTRQERDYCLALRNPYPSLAARFAAKEAAAKAFGTGIGAELGFLSISVVRNEAGQPGIVLDTPGEALLAKLGGTRLLVSLSHTATLAQAFVVIT